MNEYLACFFAGVVVGSLMSAFAADAIARKRKHKPASATIKLPASQVKPPPASGAVGPYRYPAQPPPPPRRMVAIAEALDLFEAQLREMREHDHEMKRAIARMRDEIDTLASARRRRARSSR